MRLGNSVTRPRHWGIRHTIVGGMRQALLERMGIEVQDSPQESETNHEATVGLALRMEMLCLSSNYPLPFFSNFPILPPDAQVHS